MRGITVILYDRIQNGVDAFNKPIYEETPVEVRNVLVQPATDAEVVQALDLTGKRIVYNLAIPKGDDHSWENKRVRFFDQDWQVINFEAPGIEHLIPLSWNAKVQVARYE